MKTDYSPFLPLSPATLHILLSLASEDRHGYGIMQEVARQSEGRYKLGPGTLYDNLQKLMVNGMVRETESPVVAASDAGKGGGKKDDPRRRYYRLTPQGRGVLTAEIARLEGVVREAALHLRPNPRSI